MRLYQLNFARIYCRELDTCHAFYSEYLHLEVIDYRPAKNYVIYDTGPCLLILEAIQLDSDHNMIGRHTGLSLSTADLEAQVNQLTQQDIKLTRQIEKQFWGGKTAEIADPEGNIIILSESAPA